MKIFLNLSVFAVAIIVLVSCKRNVVSPLDTPTPNAVFTFDIEGPPIVYGHYSTNLALNIGDSVQVGLSVTKSGYYEVKTDTVNGISFFGKGIVNGTGLQWVTLYGSGILNTSGIIELATKSNGLQGYNIQIYIGDKNTPAIFQFTNNVYFENQAFVNKPITGTWISAQVNVTSTGYYQVFSDTINGISFSGQGVFTDLGLQTIYLAGTGTPTSEGTFTFRLTMNEIQSTKLFTVKVTKINSDPLGFNYILWGGGLLTYSDYYATIYPSSVVIGRGEEGSFYKNGFKIEIINYDGSTIKTGVYTDKESSYYIHVIEYEQQCKFCGQTIYNYSTSSDTLGGRINQPFTINISTINSAEVEGTFSGNLAKEDGSGNIMTVTNGYFHVPL